MDPNAKPSLAGLSKEQLAEELNQAMGDFDEKTLTGRIENSLASFTQGSILEGTILKVVGSDVVVDIGYKSEGFIPLSEFNDKDEAAIGKPIEVYLEGADEETGLVMLSKRKADRIRGWERVIETHSVGDVVEGRVTRKIKGGLLVDIGVPVFLPASQVDIRRVPDVADYLGRTISAEIIKIDRDRRNIVLSRRQLLERERETQKKELFATLERGQIRRGIVKNITDFGAFVDLGGVDGLLHITDISWGRVTDPRQVVQVDQVLDVMVLDFDPDRERISLGLKQLTPNPWSDIRRRYPIGTRVKGVVVNLVPYGAFVKLEDGVEGLVHVSEMSWTKQVSHPSEIVQPNQEVEVVVLEIDEERQEISLGMKQVEEDPWNQVEAKYPPGLRVTGKVKNLTNYGAFVELEEGIEGLLHVSDISWTKKVTHPSAVLEKDQAVEAVVLSVDRERKRIALGIKQLDEDPWLTTIPRRFRVGSTTSGKVTKITSFGAFVELEQGLEGLLHVSEMSDDKVEKPEDAVQPGQEVQVRVINVDPVDRKIGLSMRASAAEEYPEEVESYAAESRGGTTLKSALSSALREAAIRKDVGGVPAAAPVVSESSDEPAGEASAAAPEPEAVKEESAPVEEPQAGDGGDPGEKPEGE
ncbi:MAG: 30S ribosomal protein S1 [Planctomycetes bacterium]|nr:30S ribosomal protein S1 [Planctomycetota bacterium]